MKIMERIAKSNRRQKFDDKGHREIDMPMDGADLRNAPRRQLERDQGLRSGKAKKGAKRRKRNR